MSSYDSDSENLPPLPPPGTPAGDVCGIIQVYMAVENDLTPAQARAVAAHIRTCPDCAHEQQVLRGLTRMVTRLPETEPSQRVDEAVFAAIAARRNASRTQRAEETHTTARLRPVPGLARRPVRKKPVSLARRASLLAAAAALVLALVTSLSFIFHTGPFQPAAWTLPASVSWKGQVLYFTQTASEKNGTTYQVTGYYYVGMGHSNVQYTIPGQMDVRVVTDPQKTLGLDMMHQVAQENVERPEAAVLSLLDPQEVRQDLQSGKAKYNGMVNYNGQSVYSITCPDSHVLLLNTDYMPVNVLDKNGKSVYDTMRWLSPSQVAPSTWDMTVPSGFQSGQIAMPE